VTRPPERCRRFESTLTTSMSNADSR
jgi:hypothetical protein